MGIETYSTLELTLNLDKKRWIVVGAGILANLCSGAAYSFSVFRGPLKDILHCRETDLALAFSLSVAFLPIGMLISGKIADQRSPRLVVMFGGMLFGLGMFLAGYTNSLLWLYATFGAMMSIGNGASYGATISAAVKWFPDRKGLASGLVVGALGIGTLIIAPVAQSIIGTPGLGVLAAFKILGIAFVVITVTASRFVVNPPSDYVPANFRPNGASGTTGSADDVIWSRMLARPKFWLLYALYALGAFSGLMVISQASPIAQEMTGLGPGAAALVVSVLGLANSMGRVFWGGISDRIGRFEALALMFLITGVVMFLFTTLACIPASLIVAIVLTGLCYGGYLGTFPSICSDAFGSANSAVNYSFLFSAFSLAGILGPRVGSSLKENTGGYAQGFVVAGIICAIGLVLSLGARLSERRSRGAQ